MLFRSLWHNSLACRQRDGVIGMSSVYICLNILGDSVHFQRKPNFKNNNKLQHTWHRWTRWPWCGPRCRWCSWLLWHNSLTCRHRDGVIDMSSVFICLNISRDSVHFQRKPNFKNANKLQHTWHRWTRWPWCRSRCRWCSWLLWHNSLACRQRDGVIGMSSVFICPNILGDCFLFLK